MTISFDAIWIPLTISGIAALWAALMLHDSEQVVDAGLFLALSIAVAWPGLIVLGSWLAWSLFA